MHTAVAEAEQENQRNYQKLRVAIEASGGILNLLIAVCDDRALREQLIQQYEAELQEKGIHAYQIRVRYQDPSLRQALARLVEQHPELPQHPAVISVLGIDELLTIKLDDDRSEQERFFGYLQWTREALLQFRYPIVLWLSNAVLVRLADRAPDFWSWRGGVFWFESPLQARIDAQIERARSLATEKGLFDPQTAAAWDAVEEIQSEISVVPEIEVVITDAVEEPYAKNAHRETRDLAQPHPELTLPDDPTGLPVEELQQLITQIEQQQGSEAPLLATLYDSLGQAYTRRLNHGEADDYPQERQHAIDAFETAIALQTRLGLESDLTNSLISVANLYRFRHKFDIAAANYERAFHLAKKLGNRWAEEAILNNLGVLYQNLGRYQQAIEFYQKSLAIAQELGDRQNEANALGNLGNVYDSLGQYERAIEFHQQSLELERELGNRQGEASTLGNLGNVYYFLGQYDRAIEFHQQSLDLTRELSDQHSAAILLGGLGTVYYSLGQHDRAIEFHQQSLDLARELGDRQGEANALGSLGNVYNSLVQYERAIKFYQQHLELARKLGDKRGEANSLGNLGNVYHSLGQDERAIEFHQQHLELVRELGDKRGEAIALFNLGLTQEKLAQTTAAVEHFHHARELYQTMGLESDVQDCDIALQRLEGETA